jgi:hypothetical protein
MMENSNAFIVDASLTEANGTAERTTALEMIDENARSGSTVSATRTTTRPTLSPAVASAAAHRTSRRTTPTAARRSTVGPPVIPVIASARLSESRSPSAG